VLAHHRPVGGHRVKTRRHADPPYLDGDIGEELAYERALPETDRAEVEAYLEGKWISGENGTPAGPVGPSVLPSCVEA
jgi:hypothetical protein